jgi:D-alanyl-D-alanine carboxypeptidase/D-alanyl-D-alanine-endopeptidase (penicillin-binding protein 4)
VPQADVAPTTTLTAPTVDAESRLTTSLAGLAARLPADSCLVVEGPGIRFAHRGGAPLVPASTAKLLTATAALEALGPDAVLDGGGVDAGRVIDLVGRMLSASDDAAAARVEAEIGGAAAFAALLDDGTVDLAGVELVDGTGHSHDNRLTCEALVDLLNRPGTGAILQDGLAVAGRSGTLAARFGDTPLDGVLRAKTGSLSSVTALAGVVDDGDPALTFALVVNTPPPSPIPEEVDALQQQIGEALVAWPVTGDG